ncbi:ABC transporter substrate-binding protein [Sinisalibacter lacisalsi]|uniref:Peptide ABC transporter n=1 Tax=Sinisalibacter lacisalsi TaxID=1526570 RepID=A0ABQ1QIU1_9RHOB|nr:ABC transporter substrate-binding protein [Sinisalibacter lacisalsi]GGD28591.1 peptide ABC transporter [Sinisalibacter lacisalsi]
MKRYLTSTALALALTAPLPAAAQDDAVSISVNIVQIVGTIDPSKVTDYTEYMAAVNLYDALTAVMPDGSVQPQLAASWEIADDNLTYTFTLADGATFTDGSPVEASDVVYSVQRLLTLNDGPAYLFADILEADNVRAVDDRTVEFTLSKVFSPFLTVTPLLFVVNEEAVQVSDDDPWGELFLAETPAGAGPYVLKDWVRGSEMTLARNEAYHAGWPNQRPIDEVRFIVTRDESTVRSLARRGELGMSSQYQSNETYEGIAAQDDYRLIEAATATGFYFKVNNQLAPTDDVHVRRAIALATDYDTIRNVIFPGGVMEGPLANIFADAVPEGVSAPVFDLEAARAELEKSPYFTGEPIQLVHGYVANTAFEEEIALLMAANLSQIGIELTLQPDPWNRITEIASSVETTPHFNQIFYGPTYPSPDSVFYVQYHSDAAGTWASMDWVLDDEIDELITQSRQETDLDAQNALYREIYTRLNEDQRTIPLLAQSQRHAMHVCLEGFDWVPMQSVEFDFSRYYWTCE